MDISLLEGHVTPRERENAELAVATTERWYMAPGVQRIDIRQNEVVGTLFLPPGEHKCDHKLSFKCLSSNLVALSW